MSTLFSSARATASSSESGNAPPEGAGTSAAPPQRCRSAPGGPERKPARGARAPPRPKSQEAPESWLSFLHVLHGSLRRDATTPTGDSTPRGRGGRLRAPRPHGRHSFLTRQTPQKIRHFAF